MKSIAQFALIIGTLGVLSLTACTQKPTPQPEPEQEEFDEARVQFIALNADGTATTDTLTVQFNREGVPSPSYIQVQPQGQYRMFISLFYKGTLINPEIEEEGTAHQFFFIPSLPAGVVNYTYEDADEDGKGIGLAGKITIGEGEFDLKIVLRHGLDKHHPDAAAWNSSNYQAAGGEDDLNISFGLHATE